MMLKLEDILKGLPDYADHSISDEEVQRREQDVRGLLLREFAEESFLRFDPHAEEISDDPDIGFYIATHRCPGAEDEDSLYVEVWADRRVFIYWRLGWNGEYFSHHIYFCPGCGISLDRLFDPF